MFIDSPPMYLNNADSGVHDPNAPPPVEPYPQIVSIRKAIAVMIPPPMTNGNMWDTPLIRCLYAACPNDSFSPGSLSKASAVPPSYTGAVPSSAFFISSSGLLIPSATFVTTTRVPSNRSIGTFVSAATIMPSALLISSVVRTFFAPPDPLVSTLIWYPSSFAFFSNASAAIYV